MKRKILLLLAVIVILAVVSQVFLTKNIWFGRPRNVMETLENIAWGKDPSKKSSAVETMRQKDISGKAATVAVKGFIETNNKLPEAPKVQTVKEPPAPKVQTVKEPPAPQVQTVKEPPAPQVQTVKEPPAPKVQTVKQPIVTTKKPPVVVPTTKAKESLPNISCQPGVPCEYNAEVGLRVIVMVFDRSKSLAKVLESLQSLELDGDTGVVEIWIDRSQKTGAADVETVKVAENFKWKHGPSRVNIQKTHVGIYGQWIDTWRPKMNSKEIGLLLEDDVDVSPFAYRWLKAAITKYRPARRIASYSIFEGAIYRLSDKVMPVDHPAFLHKRMGSQGMSPDPNHWRDFQDWYHITKNKTGFHPYVTNDPEVTSWYKNFERSGTASSMWSIWYIFYNDKHLLWTLYANLGKVMHHRDSGEKEDQYLAFHRKEKGLHFKGKPMSSKTRLITSWRDHFVEFPPFTSLKRFDYHGKITK